MALFKKKYNRENDYLRRCFDPITCEYYYVKLIAGQEKRLLFDELDIKTKKELLKDNKNLLTNKQLLNTEIDNYNKKVRFEYLKSIGYTCSSFQVMGEVHGTMSDDMRDYLDELLNEDNVLIGIHRVGSYFNQNDLDDIFEDGLKMTGHLGGAVSTSTELGQNVSYYESNKIIETELMYANLYKDSVGSILIKIPDSVLESGEDIFLFDGTTNRLNPKYIIGYVPLYENHHIENIVFNPKFYESDKKNDLDRQK